MLKNWTFTRVIYILIGGYTAISAVMEQDWLFAVIGLLFAGMGVFKVGCAGKSCQISNTKAKNTNTNEIEYEEIK